MAEAARLIPGLTGPEWVMARYQTSGRGRRGRVWTTADGNFAATLALPVAGGPAQAALRSFIAALALSDALTELAARPDALVLKWPNDVLLNGGKVAGILLEIAAGGWLLIGIGVNLAVAPAPDQLEAGAVRPVALAAELNMRIGPEALLDALAPAFARWESRFQSEGFAPIRAAWLARAARLGQPITARTGTETLTGIFETVDAEGHLVLSDATGRRSLPAADVHF
jgi:BirA family biotin operon repressor/biotin-[acetyl-CoA-carboxylase] ligase